jgi:molecular chaperone DnaK
MYKIEDLKTALKGEDKDLIKKNYDILSEAIQKIGASMYQQPEANSPHAGGGEAPQGAEGVGADAGANSGEPVEGQFEEVKK